MSKMKVPAGPAPSETLGQDHCLPFPGSSGLLATGSGRPGSGGLPHPRLLEGRAGVAPLRDLIQPLACLLSSLCVIS